MISEKTFSIGEIAKGLNVTVRTIQYYDQIGLVKPASFSEGGRRLYTRKDYMMLLQIISLKEFGFSLKEIKEKLMPAETVEEMNLYLKEQEELISEEIKRKKVTYELINKFRNEMNEVGQVDWEIFMEIIQLLRNQDENYWIVKYLDKNLYQKIKEEHQEEKSKIYLNRMIWTCRKAQDLKERGVKTDSPEGLDIAKTWWDVVIDFTKGDMKMIHQLIEFSEKSRGSEQTEFMKEFRSVEDFISESLNSYFKKQEINLK